MYKKLFLPALLGSVLVSVGAQANDSKFAATGKLGTLGAGFDVTYDINPKLNARFNFNGGSLDADGVEDGVDYKGSFDLQTIGGLLDYHPSGGGFRMTAGLYSNSNEIKTTASGSGEKVILGENNVDYTLQDDSSISSEIAFQSSAPYVGIGWGNAVGLNKRLSFSLDLGVLFQGIPESTLTGKGFAQPTDGGAAIDLAANATVQTQLAEEQENLNKDLEDFKYYPVISAGLAYKF